MGELSSAPTAVGSSWHPGQYVPWQMTGGPRGGLVLAPGAPEPSQPRATIPQQQPCTYSQPEAGRPGSPGGPGARTLGLHLGVTLLVTAQSSLEAASLQSNMLCPTTPAAQWPSRCSESDSLTLRPVLDTFSAPHRTLGPEQLQPCVWPFAATCRSCSRLRSCREGTLRLARALLSHPWYSGHFPPWLLLLRVQVLLERHLPFSPVAAEAWHCWLMWQI